MKTLFIFGSAGIIPPLALLAQVGPDPISGGAGWVGAGLLGAVLAWLLLVHLPNKDKQFQGFVEARALDVGRFQAETAAQREAFANEQAELRVAFAREQSEARALFLKEQQAHRDFTFRETNDLRQMWISTVKEMRTAVHDVKDTAQTAINQTALQQAQKAGGGS